jgi:hypothetical protein
MAELALPEGSVMESLVSWAAAGSSWREETLGSMAARVVAERILSTSIEEDGEASLLI